MESPVQYLRPLNGQENKVHISDILTSFLLPLAVYCFQAKLFISVLSLSLGLSSVIVYFLDYRGGGPTGNVSVVCFVPAWFAITFAPELTSSSVRMYLTFWTVLLYRPVFNKLIYSFKKSFSFGECSLISQGLLLASCSTLNKLYWFPNYSVPYLAKRMDRWLSWLVKYATRPLAIKLISSWMLLGALSVVVVIVYKRRQWPVSTLTRKIFHLSVILVYIPGMLYDPLLLYTASIAATVLFIFLELIRITSVPGLSRILNDYLRHFTDDKDGGSLILTNIYLLVGVSLPLWVWPGKLDTPLPLPLYAGIISVGFGDAASSIIGTLFGRTHWPGSKKTFEGAVGGFIAQLAAGVYISHVAGLKLNMAAFSSVCLLTSLFELAVDQVDNLTLPLVMYSGMHLIQVLQDYFEM